MSLKDFVQQTMAAKGLNGKEVEKRSGRRITDSYISKILNDQVKRPSFEKLRALALGLDVDEREVFEAVGGASAERETWSSTHLVFVMQKILDSPELREVLDKLIKKPSKVKAVKKVLELD